MLAVPFIIALYVLPTVASLAAYGHWDTFATQAGDGYLSFVEIGRKLGGSALGVAMLASALLGNLALYLDYLASGARPLFAISSDSLFPKGISTVSKRCGTPIAAILLMAALNAVLVIGPFRNLVVIDVILFISSYVLIFLSAVRLRIKEPGLKRPFRVPGGTAGLVAMVIPPILIVDLHHLRQRHRPQHQDLRHHGLQGDRHRPRAGMASPASSPCCRGRYAMSSSGASSAGPRTPASEAGNDELLLAAVDKGDEVVEAQRSVGACEPRRGLTAWKRRCKSCPKRNGRRSTSARWPYWSASACAATRPKAGACWPPPAPGSTRRAASCAFRPPSSSAPWRRRPNATRWAAAAPAGASP